MISEHTFSNSFTSFWKSALPNLESVVRTLNYAPEREMLPLKAETDALRRDIVSETGFRLFGLTSAEAAQPSQLLAQAHSQALYYLRREKSDLTKEESSEAIELARRLSSYAGSTGGLSQFMPSFAGHGMMTACYGDLVIGKRLVEIKYVDRTYRSTDLRQLLCYCGLRYFETGATFSEVSVFNPLRGTSINLGLEELIDSASGRSSAAFFSELSYVLSSGEISR
jgi:hypothetical protein